MIKYEYINETGRELAEKISSRLGDVETNAIVFVGALGICVRKFAPQLNDKHTDAALICVDSTGKWVIPVAGGHVGGANELARKIADLIGAQAVVTTQSDNSGLWALDLLGGQWGWKTQTLPHQEMNKAIAHFVNRQPTALVLEWEDEGTRHLEETCPEHVSVFKSFDELEVSEKTFGLVVAVSAKRNMLNNDKGERLHLQYYPQCMHLGVGCQKDVNKEVAQQLLQEVEAKGYARESIGSIASISLKKDEALLTELSSILNAGINIHTAEELAEIEVPNPSEKVKEVTGCYGVAEASALAEGGELVIEKQKGEKDGEHYTFALTMERPHGHIEIVGAGPGDPELLSIRGRRFISKADLILYAGSLVPKALTQGAKPSATIKSSAELNLEEQFALMKEFYDQNKLVVRLHTGDPCIYGAIQEQMAYFDKWGMSYHITPGISSFQAAAAELKSQFTIPEECQTIILTRGEGRTPMPDKEKLHLLAQHQSTICIYLSAGIAEQVQNELLAGGYPPETPVAACYKLTWKEQRIYRGQLKDLAKILTENNLKLTTMIVVGKAIDNRKGLSKLYDRHFTHLFRKGES